MPHPTMPARTVRILVAVVAALTITATACSSDSGTDSAGSAGNSVTGTLKVPQDYPTIQKAVDAAAPGALVLVDKGVYKEAVDVTQDTRKKTDPRDITIRGVDRNEVILDGGFKLDNGIRILGSEGIVLENMTARNYLSNGFYWTGVKRYRGSYLTAYRNGDYGIYSFDAYDGQFDHSYGSGSPDAGFYIGECFKCNAVIDHVRSEYNGLGYSGTNSGGDLFIINSEFDNNRAGVVPSSGSYELCYPSRDTTVAGNLVHDNNYLEGGGIDVSLLAQGNGILPAGAVRATITKNQVWNHNRTGIGLVPFPESDANDVAPPKAAWDTPCSDTHDKPAKGIPAEQCKAVEVIGTGCVVLWNPKDNTVTDNVVSGSGAADLAVGTVDLTGSGETTDTLGNCWSNNTAATTRPADLQQLAPCTGAASGGDWTANQLDLLTLMGQQPPKPEKNAYRNTPVPPKQENMPNATTAKAPRFTGPEKVDVASITVPPKPAGS